MKKNSITLFSTLSLSLLAAASCTGDTEDFTHRPDELSAPRIVTRSGTIPTTGSFIGFDANQELAFCYAAERPDVEGSAWEWSDPAVPHPKGDNLARLAIVMPQLDATSATYPIAQSDLGDSKFVRGIHTGAVECPDGQVPAMFRASQQLAKLTITDSEGALDNVSSLTLHLVPSAVIDFAAGTLSATTVETQAFTIDWTPGTQTYSLPIIPQDFQAGVILLECNDNGEVQTLTLPDATTVKANQTLTLQFGRPVAPSTPMSITVSVKDWVETNTIQGEVWE